MKLKDYINTITSQQDLAQVLSSIGKSIAALHKGGLIHGDLTTSNILLSFKTEQDRESLTYDSIVKTSLSISSILDSAMCETTMKIKPSISMSWVLILFLMKERAFLSTHP